MGRESSPAGGCSGKPRPEGREGGARWENGASGGWVCMRSREEGRSGDGGWGVHRGGPKGQN